MTETKAGPTTARATIAYDGPALANGAMDVRDLAPALLALGQLCQTANAAMNGDAATVSTFVRSDMKHGSFEVSIELAQIVEQAVQFLADNREQIKDAKTILEILGLIAGGTGATGYTVFKFVRWLRNRKPDQVEELQRGLIRVQIGEEVIEVSREVWDTTQDRSVRNALQEVTRPVQHAGIDTFETREPGTSNEILVSSEDVDAFMAPLADDTDAHDFLADSERVTVLEIIRPHFKAGHRWGLYDGQHQIGVEIKDQSFVSRVERGDYKFGSGDALKVKLRTRAWRDDSGALKSENIVSEVLDLLPAPTQQSLFDGPTASAQDADTDTD